MTNIEIGNNIDLIDVISEENEKCFIKLPLAIIEDKSIPKERAALFCYLWTNVGINNKLLFVLSDVYDYLHKNWNAHVYKTKRWEKNHIRMLMDKFNEIGFIKYLNEDNELICSSTKPTKIAFPKNSVFSSNDSYFTNKQFAKIYLDELEIIMSAKEHELEEDVKTKQGKDMMTQVSYVRAIDVLIVFAWLRTAIPMNIEKDSFGKKAEAYDCYFKEIAEHTGLENEVVSDAVGVLKELGLIYCEYGDMKIECGTDGKKFFNWDKCIFTNTYKRVNNETINAGKNYYLSQVEKKKKEICDYYKKKNK